MPVIPILSLLLFIQSLYSPSKLLIYLFMYTLSHVSAPLRVLFYSSLTLSGLWILDFVRFVIPPFCISEKLTSTRVQFSDLHLLVVITCILMELHARNYRLIHIVCKPFSTILDKLKITSVTGDAVIHAFATFILLTAHSLYYNITSVIRSINLNTADAIHKVLHDMPCDPNLVSSAFYTIPIFPF